MELGEEDEVAPSKYGYRVEVYKYYYKDGKLIEKVLDHRDYYRPFQGEIANGTKPTPTPSPTPSPTSTAKPIPTATDSPRPSPTPSPTNGS